MQADSSVAHGHHGRHQLCALKGLGIRRWGRYGRSMSCRLTAVLALAVCVALSGCSGEAAGDDVAASSASSTAAATATVATTTGAATTAVPAVTPAAPVTTVAAAWPPEAVAEHGRQYWAVYLEVARSGTEQAELQAALASAQSVGYGAGIGGPCEDGAVEALGLDPGTSYEAVSVFFDTESDAQSFVDLYQPGVVGTAFVTAYCLD